MPTTETPLWGQIMDCIGIIYLALMIIFPCCMSARVSAKSTVIVMLISLMGGWLLVVLLLVLNTLSVST